MYLYPPMESNLYCQMLLFLITCSFSFLLFSKSFSLNPLPSWAHDMRLLSLWFWKDFPFIPIAKSLRNTLLGVTFSFLTSRMLPKKKNSISRAESLPNSDMSILDLPDLVLECILEKLPPEGLCKMANVCSSLRERCTSDHLWENHLRNKWGRVLGPAAYKEWQCQKASNKGSIFLNQYREMVGFLINVCPLTLIRSTLKGIRKRNNFPPADSLMSWYFALESGQVWFPAQVYNRENGHVGFMLSCYDAELSYDRITDTFLARYPPHGRRTSAIETGVSWDRLRAAPVETPPHELHVSDCLHELQPGDQMEIQWRRNKEFPYGWWYGVVGHLETCDGNPNRCQCHDSETLMLEFNQYARGSRWRTTSVNRKDHKEEGNEADGFYGGIRKICAKEEISMWKKLWPAEVLE